MQRRQLSQPALKASVGDLSKPGFIAAELDLFSTPAGSAPPVQSQSQSQHQFPVSQQAKPAVEGNFGELGEVFSTGELVDYHVLNVINFIYDSKCRSISKGEEYNSILVRQATAYHEFAAV